jgi:hypothetical protein
MDKEQAKKILQKALNLEKGKEIALAKEFIHLDDKISNVDTKLTDLSEGLKKKLDEELSYEVDEEKIVDSVLSKVEIPIPKNGIDGQDYILTDKDKKEIASSIKVPVVEKETIIKKTEVIHETPIVTNEIKEVAKYEDRLQIVEKINTGKEKDLKIEAKQITGLPDFTREVIREVGGGFIETPLKAGANIAITKDAQGANVISGSSGGGTWGSITGTITAQTDLTTYLGANYYPLSSNPAGYLTSLNGAWLLNGNTNGIKKTLGSIDNFDIGFITNNIERMTILAGGNVGIGKTSPTSFLDVLGPTPASVSGVGTNAISTMSIVGGKGGNTTSNSLNAGVGSLISILAGDGGDAVNFIGGAGGTVTITGGGGGLGINGQAGGKVTIQGGAGGSTTVPGNIGGNGGELILLGGVSGVLQTGGTLTMAGGDGGTGGATGGSVSLSSGLGSDSTTAAGGDGGALNIFTGTAGIGTTANGTSGSATLVTSNGKNGSALPNSISGGASGSFTFKTGNGGLGRAATTNPFGGNTGGMTFTIGNGGAATANGGTGGVPGALNFFGGTGGSGGNATVPGIGGAGSNINFQTGAGGAGTGGTAGSAGSFNLTGASGGNGGANGVGGNGGSLYFMAGRGGTGTGTGTPGLAGNIYLGVNSSGTLGGKVSIGTATLPTALLLMAAGTATANTAPIQFTAGVVETTARTGVLETDANNNLYYTNAIPTRARVHVGGFGGSTLTAGTATVVTDASARTTSTIILSPTSLAFWALTPYVSAKANGSFTITSLVAAGTETFDYQIVN